MSERQRRCHHLLARAVSSMRRDRSSAIPRAPRPRGGNAHGGARPARLSAGQTARRAVAEIPYADAIQKSNRAVRLAALEPVHQAWRASRVPAAFWRAIELVHIP